MSTSMLSSTNSKRRALLIGNSIYTDLPTLSHAVNDTRDLANKLSSKHYDTTVGTNLTYDRMEAITEKFTENILDKDVVIFFYAGHGTQYRNRNYLIPTNDHELTCDYLLHNHAIDAEKLLLKMIDRDPLVVLFLLDCSYKLNGSNSTLESVGLCSMIGSRGSFIVFACDTNTTMEDVSNNGRNGIFTEHLLRYIDKTHLTIEEMIDSVCRDIARETNGAQTPFSCNYLRSNRIYLNIQNLIGPLRSTHLPSNARWTLSGVTVAGGSGSGTTKDQMSHPFNIYVDYHQSILIADQLNHRIVEWELGSPYGGRTVAGGNGQGDGIHQLNCPSDVIIDEGSNWLIICDRDNRRIVRWPRRHGQRGKILVSDIDCVCLTMDNDKNIYVSDDHQHEIRRYRTGESEGIRVAGGNGRGQRPDQFDEPRYVFVDVDRSIYVSDSCNHRIMKWTEDATEGVIVAGGNGKGNDLSQLSHPQGIVVDQEGTVYIADAGNQRVVRWLYGAKQGELVVGGNGRGDKSDQFNWPFGLTLDHRGNLYVIDLYNHRVQLFHIDTTVNSTC